MKSMVKELDKAESLFIQTATSVGSAKNENNLPITINKGALEDALLLTYRLL